jgi:hypothetical protein
MTWTTISTPSAPTAMRFLRKRPHRRRNSVIADARVGVDIAQVGQQITDNDHRRGG